VSGRTDHSVRVARRSERRDVAAVLAGGFQDDPVWMWICPDPDRRRRHLTALFSQVIRPRMLRDTVWTTEAHEGAAAWAAPGEWKTGTVDMLRCALPALRAIGPGHVRRGLAVLSEMEKGHPHDPHWYLEILAARVDRRGQGVGSALLAPMTDRFDLEGMPAYLESSKEENLAFYHRFGFEVTEQITFTSGCPPLWRMWRDPT
jgi:GNAT superfamily N-acetyltransferase